MSFGQLRIVSQVELSLSVTKAALQSCLIAGLVFIVSSSLHADEITIAAEVGFHGNFHLGRPFPLRVELSNLGPPVEGTLEVTVWKGGATKGLAPFAVYHRRTIPLAAQARKSAWFTVDPGSISRPLLVTFHSARGSSARKEIDLRRHFSPVPLILLLTASNLMPQLPLAPASPAPLVAVSPEELPADARAYGGVSTVVFYEPSLRDLSKAQAGALESWLVSGGRMAVLGSLDYALYQEPSIGRFLPVRVTGLKHFAALGAMERSYGSKAAQLKNVTALDSTLLGGRSLIEENGTPILVERSRGKGKILYLALDIGRPPLSRWEGLPRLLRDILGAPVESRSAMPTSWDEAVFTQLLLNPALLSSYVPVGAFFMWMVFYLAGLGVVTWLWQKRRLRWRRLALIFLSLVVLSASGGYLQFRRGGKIPDGVLLAATVLEPLADGYVEGNSNVAIFSTLRRDYDLALDGGWSDFDPVPRRGGRLEDNALVALEEAGRPRFRVALREWDHRLFRGRSVSRFPLSVEFDAREDKRVLKVSNLTAHDLTDCWLILAGERIPLGDVASGSTRAREFPLAGAAASAADGRSRQVDLRDIPFKDKTRELLFRASFFPQEHGLARWSGNAALFFGWVKDAPRRIRAGNGRVSAQDFTLFRAVFPLADEEDL
jgi:hypothetical protein